MHLGQELEQSRGGPAYGETHTQGAGGGTKTAQDLQSLCQSVKQGKQKQNTCLRVALDPWEGLCSRGWDSSVIIVPFNFFLSELNKRQQINDRTGSSAVQVCELGPVLNRFGLKLLIVCPQKMD